MFGEKPTIAILNGNAVGGGCELASAFDFRLARSGIKLGFVQASLGITTGWGGASFLFGEDFQQSHTNYSTEHYISEKIKQLGFKIK